MLVLSRKANESIMIGDVEITIVEIRGDKCRVGIEAPKDVPVHRKEVYNAIKQSLEATAKTREVIEQRSSLIEQPVLKPNNLTPQEPME